MKTDRILRVAVLLLAAAPAFAQVAPPPPGRLLASNCFQCHGTNGTGGVEKLTGESAGEIYKELKEMQSKVPPKMMEMHARGFTDEELRTIANYFAAQR